MQRPSERRPPAPRHARATSAVPMKDAGVQLLSPSLQRGLRATTTNQPAKAAVFDFDSFTLEAVRRRHEGEPAQLHAGSFLHSVSMSSSGGSPRSPSRATSHLGRATHSFYKSSLDGHETHSVRSMDDYDWGHRNTHVSSYSSGSQRLHAPPFHSMSSVGTLSKRMSMASSTTSSALQGGGVARLRAEVAVRGWLQRRRGRVLKRWKPQYCVLKTDQRLCLYASEDTVNGRLEGRFTLLRATYNDKHGSFQVIGIGSDETPYKEEFKPLDDDGWRAWFLALREFFTPASIHEALERMPELSLLPGVHASLLEDNDDEDDDDGTFAQEVEEMVMRPYGYGSGSVDERRASVSNASTASSSNQPRVHHYAEPSPASDRKTVLFDPNDLLRYTTSNNQAEDAADVATALPERASHYRKLYTGGTRAKATSIASSTGSGVSVFDPVPQPQLNSDPRLRRGPSGTGLSGPVDCPMIERDSQNAVAILERCGSESVVSTTESDVGYSWNRV